MFTLIQNHYIHPLSSFSLPSPPFPLSLSLLLFGVGEEEGRRGKVQGHGKGGRRLISEQYKRNLQSAGFWAPVRSEVNTG